MPATIFGAPTGPVKKNYANLIPGSPDYNEAVVDQAAETSRPYFEQNQRGLKDNLLSRDMLDSGLGFQAELGQKEAWLRHLGDTSTKAALHGADVGEENRRAVQRRSWQVEDRDLVREDLRERAAREEEAANRAIWGNLIGVAGTAVGSYFGGPVGGALVGGGAKALFDANGDPVEQPGAKKQELPEYDPYFGYDAGPPPAFE